MQQENNIIWSGWLDPKLRQIHPALLFLNLISTFYQGIKLSKIKMFDKLVQSSSIEE